MNKGISSHDTDKYSHNYKGRLETKVEPCSHHVLNHCPPKEILAIRQFLVNMPLLRDSFVMVKQTSGVLVTGSTGPMLFP